MPTYYEVLKLDPNAAVEIIEAAIDDQYNQFRRLINHHDPNVVEQANRALRQLEVIRETLTNHEKRVVYDQSLNLGGLVDLNAVLQSANSRPTPMFPPVPKTVTSGDAALNVWTCGKCGKPNRVGSKTCTNCGTMLARDCPNRCGSLVRLDEKYCANCGKSVDEALSSQQLEFEQAQQGYCDELRGAIQSKHSELNRLNWFSNNIPLAGSNELNRLLSGDKIVYPIQYLILIIGVPIITIFAGLSGYPVRDADDVMSIVLQVAVVGILILAPLILLYRYIVLPRTKAKAQTIIGKAIDQRQEYIRHAELRLQQEQAKAFDPRSPQEYVPDSATTSVWEVILTSIGSQKINVIRIVQQRMGLGLKEAKDLVEAAPSTILTTNDKSKADMVQSLLEKSGASVSVVARTALPR